MATGGRVLHHLARRLPDARNTIVLPGFQAPGTRGHTLAQGARSVKLLGRYVPVHAEVLSLNAFSVHADADELLTWLGRIPTPPDETFVVHGDPEASATLRDRIETELHWVAATPRHLERVLVA
jgi:metallo-beta-lactamase family protein